jgi:Amt family ammonium transporter
MLVYVPVVFWLFGRNGAGDLIGFLGKRGSLDFAGGTAIHINAGVAALAFVLVLGKRRGWPAEGMPPHSMPFTLLGAGILFFGWFGFNAGSAGAANGIAVQAFLNTFVAGAAATMSWIVAERIKDGHFTTLGAASGAVAGLVAITPCAGYVPSMASIPIGIVAGAVCFLAIQLKYRFGYDDALDVVGVHMVGGILGGLLLGLFADRGVNPGIKYEGLFMSGSVRLLSEQALSIAVVMIWSFTVTFILVKALDALIGLRVSEEDEVLGLDRSQHAETAYNLGLGGTRVG